MPNAPDLIFRTLADPTRRAMLARLLAADVSIPAGRVASRHAIVLADREASGSA